MAQKSKISISEKKKKKMEHPTVWMYIVLALTLFIHFHCTYYMFIFESIAYYYHFLVFYCKSIFCDPSCESLNDAAVNEWRLTTPLQKIKKGMVIDSCAIFKLNEEERDRQKTFIFYPFVFFAQFIYWAFSNHFLRQNIYYHCRTLDWWTST